ncbi:nucleotide pyrophosphohydrolase [Flavitalea antarctica]
MPNDFDAIKNALLQFRDERNWEQFHDAKNLAIALSIEASELNQLFLWKKDAEIAEVKIDRLKEELADVFAYAFLLAIKYDFNVKEIVLEKILKNEEKYPVGKAKGKSAKYDEL